MDGARMSVGRTSSGNLLRLRHSALRRGATQRMDTFAGIGWI